MPSDYVSIHVKRPTQQRLQGLQLRLSADVGRRLTVTEIISTALELLEQHRSEAVKTLSMTD
jgi:hypothetical protein